MTSDRNADCADGGCEEALAELEAYLDGELPDTRLEDIEQHLSACYPCTDRATFEERLRAIVRSGCVDDPPERLVASIRAHLDVTGTSDAGT